MEMRVLKVSWGSYAPIVWYIIPIRPTFTGLLSNSIAQEKAYGVVHADSWAKPDTVEPTNRIVKQTSWK